MLLSTSTGPLLDKFTEREAVELIKQAGFDAYDSTLWKSMKNESSPFSGDGAIEYAKELRRYADSIGIVCNQAHAPFPSSVGDAVKDEEIFQNIVRSMEIAAALGAQIIVVHPKQHLCYAEHAEELFKLNLEFYARLIPYCKSLGIKIATENMWQRNSASKAIGDSCCSRAWEFNKYIDTIDSEYITGCLDIGHVSLVTNDIQKFIRDMGAEHISALHVHDTDFLTDSHTMPFLKSIDFGSVVAALAEIGYKGDFTFEPDYYFTSFPKPLYTSALKLLCDVGRYLISELERAKN